MSDLSEGSATNTEIQNRKELMSEYINIFDFVDIIAAAASQLHQDNQLLLLIHKHVTEMQTTDGKRQLEAEREEQRQKYISVNQQRAREIIQEYCKELSDDDVINFLLVCVMRRIEHRMKERVFYGIGLKNNWESSSIVT